VDGARQALENAYHENGYHPIYQIGSEEIRHRLDKDNDRVERLSGGSIQAIRASLDAGLVHENRITVGRRIGQ
jgi:biopolymer transport protein ExbB